MKNYQKVILGLFVVMVALVIIIKATSNKKDSVITKPIKIGFVLPLTGIYAAYGEEFKRGAEVAIDEIIDQKPEVIFEDSALEVKKATNAVVKLVQQDKVDSIVVSAYMEAAATHQVSDSKNIPMLVLWDSNKQLEDMGDHVFASGPWTPASGEVSANFATITLKAKTAAAFGYKQEWSIAVTESFEGVFIKNGGKFLYKSFSAPGNLDYRTELFKIKEMNPDVVYMTTEDMFTAVKQLREAGYKGTIITSDVLDDELVGSNPELFAGVYESLVADPATQQTSHYIDLYKKKFGFDPKKLLYGTWGYDAVWLMYNAAKSSTSIKNGLYATQNYQGASGSIGFTPEGSSKIVPVMFVIKNGKIEKVK